MKTKPAALVKVIILISVVLLVPACQKSELGKEINFRVGEKQKINSNLSFKVDSILDSRCPHNALCGLAGDVDLFFTIYHSHNQVDTLLVCYPGSDMVPFVVEGYKWKVLEVDPYPDASHPIVSRDALISMIITKN